MKKIVFAVALALLSSTAFAKKATTPPPAQNHSCILDGAVVEKTKKQCLKAKGKWEKNAPVPAATTESAAPVAAPATPVATPATETAPAAPATETPSADAPATETPPADAPATK